MRRRVDAVSLAGLVLLVASMVLPFAALDNELLISVCKYTFAVGSVVYTVARLIDVNEPGDSMRLRRLRRMEMASGFAFLVAAFFWFYNSARFAGLSFSLAVMKDTVTFTLAGAVIQIIASWMIAWREQKERKNG